MNIVVDENIPGMTVTVLLERGHIVTDVRGTPDQSKEDDSLWDRAMRERALLISTDKGFRHKRDEEHWGILIVRLRQPDLVKIHARIMQAINRFPEREWPGLLVIMRDRTQSVQRTKRRRML